MGEMAHLAVQEVGTVPVIRRRTDPGGRDREWREREDRDLVANIRKLRDRSVI